MTGRSNQSLSSGQVNAGRGLLPGAPVVDKTALPALPVRAGAGRRGGGRVVVASHRARLGLLIALVTLLFLLCTDQSV